MSKKSKGCDCYQPQRHPVMPTCQRCGKTHPSFVKGQKK